MCVSTAGFQGGVHLSKENGKFRRKRCALFDVLVASFCNTCWRYFQSPTKIHLLRKLQRIIEVDWSRFLANNLSDFWIHRLADKRSQSVQSTCYSDTIYHRLLKTHLLRSSAWFRKYHFSFKNSLFLLSTQDTRFRASR